MKDKDKAMQNKAQTTKRKTTECREHTPGPPPDYSETPPWHHGSYGAAAACDAMEENDSTEVLNCRKIGLSGCQALGLVST